MAQKMVSRFFATVFKKQGEEATTVGKEHALTAKTRTDAWRETVQRGLAAYDEKLVGIQVDEKLVWIEA